MPRTLVALFLLACTPAAPTTSTMTETNFARYIALGDSISIDIYPSADIARRYPGRASTDRVGAVSLLVRNDDRLWPEFRGRDLRTLQPSLRFDARRDDLTADGATTESVLRQVERIERSDEPTLVTITAGGNDLLGYIGSPGPSPSPAIAGRLRTAIGRVLELRPNAVVLVGTVYDPSDGTNRLPGYTRALDREAEWLAEYNDLVRRLVASDRRLRLADVHRHFLGHGLTVPEDERWYLRESIIEPSARGGSEVRRVWLETLRF
ncbi:MAG TPA: SGNH/GDSL hydrolase family protein [Thermoanaerobaculia bacterium]|nr:SGNH/GDSL hydrolase family protein [Thermoanaerobaculia bacterium]